MSSENYSIEELKNILGSIGSNVVIHKSVVFFNAKNIHIGSNVRIDCFSLMSAGTCGIKLGNNIHIGASTHLFGSGGSIIVDDFANISSRVSLFTASDDYKDGFLTNPTIPNSFKKLDLGCIYLCRHSIIGCGSVLLPNVQLSLGASVGALSLVKNNVESFQIVAGIPAKVIGVRSYDVLEYEKKFLETVN